MSYLSQLQTLCWRIFAKLDHPPDQIDQGERITRFIFVQRYVDLEKQVVEPEAFFPPKDKRMSIYRTNNCSDKKVWWLGDWFVARKRTDRKKVLARGDLHASDFATANLELKPYRDPHPRHTHAEGWPDDRASQGMKALELANRATLLVKPSLL